MFGLEDKYIQFIKETLNEHLKNAQFYVFGSRAKGNYQKYSDIDIAIDNNGQKVNSEIISKINTTFESSTIPYEIDIVDLNSINNEFKDVILKTYKSL